MKPEPRTMIEQAEEFKRAFIALRDVIFEPVAACITRVISRTNNDKTPDVAG